MSWLRQVPGTLMQGFWLCAGFMLLVRDAVWMEVWMNGVLLSGMVLFCLTNALFPLLGYFSVAKLLKVSLVRSLQLRSAGIAAASTVVCVGAAMTRSEVGYLAAGCAGFYAWLNWWLVTKFNSASA